MITFFGLVGLLVGYIIGNLLYDKIKDIQWRNKYRKTFNELPSNNYPTEKEGYLKARNNYKKNC